MSHLASAESDPAFTALQIERFREATAQLRSLTRHIANSAATLRYAEARFDAVRCGIALYGISPFGTDPGADGLEPALRWESYLALVKRLEPGESTGYGRRFVADRPTWIGIVPVGYADGFRRDMTGTEVLVDGARRPVVGNDLHGRARRRASTRELADRSTGDARRGRDPHRGARASCGHDRRTRSRRA